MEDKQLCLYALQFKICNHIVPFRFFILLPKEKFQFTVFSKEFFSAIGIRHFS